jgi:hypothetical protein
METGQMSKMLFLTQWCVDSSRNVSCIHRESFKPYALSLPLFSSWYNRQMHNPTRCLKWFSLVFRKWLVKISARTLTILNEFFCGFPQFLQTNNVLVP